MPPKRKRLVPQSPNISTNPNTVVTSIVLDTTGECIALREIMMDPTPSPKRSKYDKSESIDCEKNKRKLLLSYATSKIFTVDPKDTPVSVFHKWTIHRVVSCYYLLRKLYTSNRDEFGNIIDFSTPENTQPHTTESSSTTTTTTTINDKNDGKKYPERYDVLDEDQTFISLCYDILQPHSVITPVSNDNGNATKTDSNIDSTCKQVVFYLLTMILSIHNLNNSRKKARITTGATLTNRSGSKKSYYYQGDIILLQIAKYFSIDNDTSTLDHLRDTLIEKIQILFDSDNTGIWYLYILEVSRAFFALMNTPDLMNYTLKLVKCLLYTICIKSTDHLFPLHSIKLPRNFFYDISDISREVTSVEDRLAINVTIIFLNNQRKLSRNLEKLPNRQNGKNITVIDTSESLNCLKSSDTRLFESTVRDIEFVITASENPKIVNTHPPTTQIPISNTPFVDSNIFVTTSDSLHRDGNQTSDSNTYSKWLGEYWDEESIQKSLNTSESVKIVQNNFRLIPRAEIPLSGMTIKKLIEFVSGIYLKHLIRDRGTLSASLYETTLSHQNESLNKELQEFKTITKKFISKEKSALSLFAKKYLRLVKNSNKLYISYTGIESCEQPQYHRNFQQTTLTTDATTITNTTTTTNTSNSTNTITSTDSENYDVITSHDVGEQVIPSFGLHTLGDTPIDLLRKILRVCKDSHPTNITDKSSDTDCESDNTAVSSLTKLIEESIHSYLSTNTKKKK